MSYEKLIGLYFGEPELMAWLQALGITKVPKLKRGDDTCHLSQPSLGIELTFRDSETLQNSNRSYPDGSLVLSNIRFYGLTTDEFSSYAGELPFDITFGSKKADLIAAHGEPNWSGTFPLNKLRWNKGRLWLLVSFNNLDRAEIVALQHPM